MSTDKVVIVPRGIPGSGKTTWVLEQMEGYEDGTAVRLNNDDLSAMLYGKPFSFSENSAETLADLRVTMLKSLLSQDHITDIYVDNTNLSMPTVRTLEKVAQQAGARFVVVDHFLDISVEEAIERDSKRERPVGESVVRSMHTKAKKLKPWNYLPPYKIEKYENDPDLPPVILVDIDGTLAIKHPDRDIHEYHKVHMDFPNEPVIRAVRALRQMDHKIILMSGRVEDCRDVTEAWIERNVGYGIPLYMRKSGDFRQDYIVKHELFQEHIAGKYRVLMSFDDRDQVVDLWRRKLGIPTFQVADGNF